LTTSKLGRESIELHSYHQITKIEILSQARQNSFSFYQNRKKHSHKISRKDLESLYLELLYENNTIWILSFKKKTVQANFDISNSDMSNSCEILLLSNSLSQSKCFLKSNHGCGDSFYKFEIHKVQINLNFGYFELVEIVPKT